MIDSGFPEKVIPYSGTCGMVHVTDQNLGFLRRPAGENLIMTAALSSFDSQIRPRGLALKYIADGLETYWLNNKRYPVNNGSYLLVNETIPSMDVVVKGAKTWSVCVDIDLKLVNDLLHQILAPDELDGYADISQYLLSPEIFIRESVAGKQLQHLLNSLITIATSQSYSGPLLELIFELTGLLVEENLSLIQSYYKLKIARLNTRKELFQRLLLGKEILDDSIFTNITISELAKTCCLSEFRFYRLFKQCFGISPYHYHFRKRIEKSIELKKQNMDWEDIAFQLNFTDLAAFSKGFKKIKGVPPSKIMV